jgi:hypothetical protein
MAVPSPNPAPPLESFSAQERFLIEKSEEAIRDGSQLEQWIRRQGRNLALFPLNLNKAFRLPNRAYGFFGSLEINGATTSVMGCRQDVELGRIAGANPQDRLREFVLAEFLPRAHWTYPDGSPGGFTIEKSLYKSVDGSHGRFLPEAGKGCIDWRQIGAQYSWVFHTLEIHDFVMDFGPFRKRFREAICFAAHPDFVHVVENPSGEHVFEVTIGYPVVEFAPIPNSFGFGPGKFKVAAKIFSFFLTPDNEVRVRLHFAAAPRCEKVLDFGKRWPDPVYGGASLLHYLTLRRWDPQPFHDRLDAKMLAQHCRVHQAVMDGVGKIWREWAGG